MTNMDDVYGVLEVDTSSPYVRVEGDKIFIAPPAADEGELDLTGYTEVGYIEK